MTRGLRRRARIRILSLFLALLATLLTGSVFTAYAYDRANEGRILPGVRIDGMNVGNMTEAEAMHAVAARASQILSQPIVIRAGAREWNLTLGALGVEVEVTRAVNEALSVSDSLSWMSRVYHRLTDRSVDRPIQLRYRISRAQAKALIEQVATAIDKPAQDAAIKLSKDGMAILKQPAHPGRAVDVAAGIRRLVAALETGTPEVTLSTHPIEPTVSANDLGKTLTIDLSTNTLRLYDGFKVVKTYQVATARPGFSSPVGVWKVIAKEDHPAWYNPAPNGWGAGMPLYIPPGPDNPLGLRALGLNAPGIFIHGTPESWTVGTYASHGCIRMFESDAIQLFPLVPAGTPAIIYGSPPWGTGGASAQPGP